MFVEKIKSEGLAHLSYLIGSNGMAAVVDPRRDCEVYVQAAAERDCRITHIFETHRNEDLLSGAAILSEWTGAPAYHGPNPAAPITYARTANEGEEYDIGDAVLRVLETPGHTDDSISLVLIDKASAEDAVGVFTGDALFVGDVGRTDFYPDRPREVAGLLYDSLQKIIALGDQAVVYPAHGAGSVCGSAMASREVSTVGYERRNNPRLQLSDREQFIQAKLAEDHETPPYFRFIEEQNVTGCSDLPRPLTVAPLTSQMMKDLGDDTLVLDVRSPSAFLGAHLPGTLAIPVSLIPAFAGWLLSPDDRLALVAENAAQAEMAARHLARIGYDHVAGFLAPSLAGWAAHGEQFVTLPVVDVETVRTRRAEHSTDWTLLDVRSAAEAAEFKIDGSQHIYVGELASRLGELDRETHHTVMCGSGARATIGASILSRAGFHEVDLFLGSIGAWKHEEQGEAA